MTLSRTEWLALAIARLIRDGDRVSIGTNLPAARAGAMLAKLTHAPHSTLFLGMAEVRTLPFPPPDFLSLSGGAAEASGHQTLEGFFSDAQEVDFFVVGGMQIDPWGNTNLLGIGPAELPVAERFAARTVFGPGPIGTVTMTAHARRYVLFAADHQPRTFVPELAFRTTVGWGDGGSHRDRLGLPGGGPVACVTELGVFDYPWPDRRMRLRAPFQGVTFGQIAERTGFSVERPAKLQEYPLPTARELQVLREVVDPRGRLRDR